MAKEFWISTGFYPTANPKHAAWGKEPTSPTDIHVVEYSAYEEVIIRAAQMEYDSKIVVQDLESLRSKYDALLAQANKLAEAIENYNWGDPIDPLEAALANFSKFKGGQE